MLHIVSTSSLVNVYRNIAHSAVTAVKQNGLHKKGHSIEAFNEFKSEHTLMSSQQDRALSESPLGESCDLRAQHDNAVWWLANRHASSVSDEVMAGTCG